MDVAPVQIHLFFRLQLATCFSVILPPPLLPPVPSPPLTSPSLPLSPLPFPPLLFFPLPFFPPPSTSSSSPPLPPQMERTPLITRKFHARATCMICLLVFCDAFLMGKCLAHVWVTGPSVQMVFALEVSPDGYTCVGHGCMWIWMSLGLAEHAGLFSPESNYE